MKWNFVFVCLTTACIVVEEEPHHHQEPISNYTPVIGHAYVGCSFDYQAGDDVITFESEVFDDNGAWDVTAVFAYVYNVDRQETLISTFELYRDAYDADFWFSDWWGQEAPEYDCYFPYYEVDLIAYDAFGAYGSATVVPYYYY